VERLVEVLRPAAKSGKHLTVRPSAAIPHVKSPASAGNTKRRGKERGR